MKKFIFGIVIFLCFTVSGYCASIKFTWDARPEPDVMGYKLHAGNFSGQYHEVIDVGPVTSFLWDNVLDGEWFFAVTAYDSKSESPFSKEVSMVIDTGPPGAPIMFKATIETGRVTVEPKPE